MKNRASLNWRRLLAAALAAGGISLAGADQFPASTEAVGAREVRQDQFVTPVNQILTPAGVQIEAPTQRPGALALSPDRHLLVVAGLARQLSVIGAQTGKTLQHVPFPPARTGEAAASGKEGAPDDQGQLSFTGLAFSPDGRRIYLSNVRGDVKVFDVSKNRIVTPAFSIALPPPVGSSRKTEIPAGLAVSPDGASLYVALNLSDRLAEFDTATGKLQHLWDVGVAPFDVAFANGKVYVSNWGGRRPAPGDLVGPAGQGAVVRIDPVRSVASEGSVSVIDLANHHQTEILTGLHCGALAKSPNGKYLVAANAGSDTLSVIDTRTDRIAEVISARQNPGDPFGAQPDALAFDESGKKLFVCNGTQNAVAVIRFDPGNSQWLGLIPVGWFPSAIAFDASRDQIYVANLKGLSQGIGPYKIDHYHNTLSLVPVPSAKKLAAYTQTALANLRHPLLVEAGLPPRPAQPPRPVPERAGEPSVFQHVIYIIKENHTYDQILGDVKGGNGYSSLCDFGRLVTPNQHKLVRDFVLLDNAYCCGMVSADGHQWAVSGLANDYIERSASSGWPRTYPFGGDDALGLSPAGCIWDDALAHGRSVRDYGEFCWTYVAWKDPSKKTGPSFLDFYRDFTGGSNAIICRTGPNLVSLQPCVATNTAAWDLDVPDVFRASVFIKDLRKREPTGDLAHLTILWLPCDHTSGTHYGSPTPRAQVADNDLAVGQIVEAVSHSRFWTNTCIFAVEDDPQAGWDHVSSFRTTAYVASAYTKRGVTVSVQYNQTSLLRTMELMLGLPPMNQMDATATPMFECFTNVPDFAAFDAVTNNIPLDEMNPNPAKISDARLRKDALISARLPLALPDQCPEDLLNHILWRATMGGQPYPDWAVHKSDD